MITNCGVVYGLFAKKAGKTLNVSTEEGQIVINTIKREICFFIIQINVWKRLLHSLFFLNYL